MSIGGGSEIPDGLRGVRASASASASGAAMEELLRIQNSRLREKLRKQSRTHSLLVSIVVVFALSWFPLNVLNIVLDVCDVAVSEVVLSLTELCLKPLKSKL